MRRHVSNLRLTRCYMLNLRELVNLGYVNTSCCAHKKLNKLLLVHPTATIQPVLSELHIAFEI